MLIFLSLILGVVIGIVVYTLLVEMNIIHVDLKLSMRIIIVVILAGLLIAKLHWFLGYVTGLTTSAVLIWYNHKLQKDHNND